MDADSFKRQYLPLHPKLFRVAFALVGNKEDAEDLMQEAYFKLWNKRNELSRIKNAEAFSVTLIKNLCLDFLRSPKARRRDERESPERVMAAASEYTPDKELESLDEIGHIKQLINRLPENQQQVLRLRSLSGCSMEEIEQITGFSAVNVRTLLSRARKMLKEQYEKLHTI